MPSCIVVGAGAGNGRAIAARFARGGHAVGLVARDAGRLAAVAEAVRGDGGTVATRAADAADFAALAAAVSALIGELGGLDVLVYNPAGVTMQPPSALPPARLMADLSVSVGGALAAVQAALPTFRAQRRGTILLTGGGFAFEPMPAMASVGVGKAAIRNLAFSLFKELEPEGIHAATVTIAGMIKPGTAFDPDLIAEHYWRLAGQAPGAFEREAVVK